MQEQSADPQDQELMQALGKLRLSPPGLSQRDIWYRAGVDAGRRHANAWKALAAIVTVAAGVGVAMDHRPAPAPRMTYVQHVERPATTDAKSGTSSSASLAYERMRDKLVEEGLRGLPPIDFTGDGGQSPLSEDTHSIDRGDAVLRYR
jgi:hypothetical protein